MERATLKVKAGANGPVPMTGSGGSPKALKWIGAEPVEVENSRYYRRRIAAGDLVVVTDGQ